MKDRFFSLQFGKSLLEAAFDITIPRMENNGVFFFCSTNSAEWHQRQWLYVMIRFELSWTWDQRRRPIVRWPPSTSSTPLFSIADLWSCLLFFCSFSFFVACYAIWGENTHKTLREPAASAPTRLFIMIVTFFSPQSKAGFNEIQWEKKPRYLFDLYCCIIEFIPSFVVLIIIMNHIGWEREPKKMLGRRLRTERERVNRWLIYWMNEWQI